MAQRALEELIGSSSPTWCCSAIRSMRLGFGPAVAASLGLGFASDATALSWDGGPVVGRGAYGDKLFSELEFPGKGCTLVMLRPGTFEPRSGRDPADRHT